MGREYPWDYHPDLTASRLVEVARLLEDGRNTALDHYDEELGDNGWTLGCRAFQFARARILWAVDGDDHPWLSAIDRTLQLIFQIGEVPVRIYKGEADDPNERTLRQTYYELKQLRLMFPEHDDARDLAYRFAIETDVDGAITAVKFVGLRGGTAVLCWDIPRSEEGRATVIPIEEADAGVALSAPPVSIPRVEKKKDGAA